MDGTVLVDERGEMAEALALHGVPTNVFVDSDGQIIEIGATRPEDLEAATARLLGVRSVETRAPESTDWPWQKDREHIERHVRARKNGPDE